MISVEETLTILADKWNYNLFNENEKNSDYYLGELPNVYYLSKMVKYAGLYIHYRDLDKCMRKPNNNNENHELSIENMHKIAKELSRPAMILKGSKVNTIVSVIGCKDKNENEIIVAIDLDHSTGGNPKAKINAIVSSYGKREFCSYINKQLAKNNIIAYNKEKSNTFLNCVQLQLLDSKCIAYDNSIANK